MSSPSHSHGSGTLNSGPGADDVRSRPEAPDAPSAGRISSGSTSPGVVPGDAGSAGHSTRRGVRTYLIGLGLAIVMTVASFWAAQTHLIYGPGISVAIVALAIAQMGIHLVFFLHITTDPDNTNNVLALAFGILIACLVIFGSLWIMANLNRNMMTEQQMLQMQR